MFTLSQRVVRHPLTDQHSERAEGTQVFFDRCNGLHERIREIQAADNELMTQLEGIMGRRSQLLRDLAEARNELAAAKAELALYESMKDD